MCQAISFKWIDKSSVCLQCYWNNFISFFLYFYIILCGIIICSFSYYYYYSVGLSYLCIIIIMIFLTKDRRHYWYYRDKHEQICLLYEDLWGFQIIIILGIIFFKTCYIFIVGVFCKKKTNFITMQLIVYIMNERFSFGILEWWNGKKSSTCESFIFKN